MGQLGSSPHVRIAGLGSPLTLSASEEGQGHLVGLGTALGARGDLVGLGTALECPIGLPVGLEALPTALLLANSHTKSVALHQPPDST